MVLKTVLVLCLVWNQFKPSSVVKHLHTPASNWPLLVLGAVVNAGLVIISRLVS